MRSRLGLIAGTMAIAALLLHMNSALAHGALAVGQPSSVANGGVAVGYTWNYDSEGDAQADALKQCLSYMDAPDSTRALCKVVRVFSHQCVAIALDPNVGTEGFGWAVADTESEASDRALQICKDTDGPEHANDCSVPAYKCDQTP
ncbi:MAG TPA: DUF4189 domain-containing protein [Rhizomicrobium sp.]|nr:DUF4189 domain-containing protein [Rhizomicrobium sp.]